MPKSKETTCCKCCTFIFSSGLTALFLWLGLRTSNPTLSIEEFYVPALNKTANDTQNTTIFFHLKLNNGNKDKAIFYDPLNLTFYYNHNLSFPVANITIPGFHQGHKKKAHRKDQKVETVGVPWKTAQEEVSSTGTTKFRVDLATAVRFKIIFWKTRHHKMMVGGNIRVNDEGKKAYPPKKGVKLSCASVNVSYCAHVSLLIMFVLGWIGL